MKVHLHHLLYNHTELTHSWKRKRERENKLQTSNLANHSSSSDGSSVGTGDGGGGGVGDGVEGREEDLGAPVSAPPTLRLARLWKKDQNIMKYYLKDWLTLM